MNIFIPFQAIDENLWLMKYPSPALGVDMQRNVSIVRLQSGNLPFPTRSLLSPPMEWADEIAVAAVEGAPDFSEIVILHKPSRTLIVGDLLFNFGGNHGIWMKLLLTLATVGGRF